MVSAPQLRMQNLQSNAKKMIYGEAAAQLTAPFVLLMIKASVNLPRVIFRSFLQKSQHPLAGPTVCPASSQHGAGREGALPSAPEGAFRCPH